jgi:hypothetical protein
MPTFPSYDAETARAIYNEYWDYKNKHPGFHQKYRTITNRVSCQTLATKYNLKKGTIFHIVHKTGRFNARVLQWVGVATELFHPERQMTLEEMGQSAGGPLNWTPDTHQKVDIPTSSEWED